MKTKSLIIVFIICTVLFLTCNIDLKYKLLGEWETVEIENNYYEPAIEKVVSTFYPDNSFINLVYFEDGSQNKVEGSYTLKGVKLTLTFDHTDETGTAKLKFKNDLMRIHIQDTQEIMWFKKVE